METLVKRIEVLESQLRWTKHMLGTMMLTVAVLIGVAAIPNTPSSMELVSPNGTQKVTIKADDYASGLWVTRGQKAPLVTLWASKDGGFIQLIDKDKTVHQMPR